MATLRHVLYVITTGLLIPVIICLLFLLIKSLMLVGGFFALMLRRTRHRAGIQEVLRQFHDMHRGNRDSVSDDLRGRLHQSCIFAEYVHSLTENRGNNLFQEKILSDFERYGERELEQPRILLRVGPMLGLMGTLIPLAPALSGLAAGNLAILAENLQVAFSTTVIGLLIGAIGFFSSTVRRRWLREDLANLTYMKDVLQSKETGA